MLCRFALYHSKIKITLLYVYISRPWLEVLNLPSYKHPSRSHDHRPVFNVKNNKQQTNTYTKTLKGTKADPKRREKILKFVIVCHIL